MMLRCTNLGLVAGDFSLSNISFDLEAGAWGTIMGPTGCGKSTLIEGLCGLRRVQAGRIEIGGKCVTHVPPRDRGIGFVPQDAAIFTGMPVEAVMGMGLRARGVPRAARRVEVTAMARELGVEPLLRRTAAGLSGGERQRIALGRALLCRPEVLLLDEPLTALDADTRESIRDLLVRITRAQSLTVLHVTHDDAEATALASVRWRLREGVLALDAGG